VFLGRRDEVVLRLLLDTGVRVSELCGLELTDVDLDRELAYVTGKGSRPRVVPFGAKTAQAVDRYLRVRALHPYARLPRTLSIVAVRSARQDFLGPTRRSPPACPPVWTAHAAPPIYLSRGRSRRYGRGRGA
jgi:integrase